MQTDILIGVPLNPRSCGLTVFPLNLTNPPGPGPAREPCSAEQSLGGLPNQRRVHHGFQHAIKDLRRDALFKHQLYPFKGIQNVDRVRQLSPCVELHGRRELNKWFFSKNPCWHVNRVQ